jgi:hypothetical protein
MEKKDYAVKRSAKRAKMLRFKLKSAPLNCAGGSDSLRAINI